MLRSCFATMVFARLKLTNGPLRKRNNEQQLVIQ